jgi:hypothetical protein
MEEKALVVPASLLFFLCVTFLVVISASGQGINNADYDEYDTLNDAVLMMLLIYFYQIGWMAVVLFTPLSAISPMSEFSFDGRGNPNSNRQNLRIRTRFRAAV